MSNTLIESNCEHCSQPFPYAKNYWGDLEPQPCQCEVAKQKRYKKAVETRIKDARLKIAVAGLQVGVFKDYERSKWNRAMSNNAEQIYQSVTRLITSVPYKGGKNCLFFYGSNWRGKTFWAIATLKLWAYRWGKNPTYINFPIFLNDALQEQGGYSKSEIARIKYAPLLAIDEFDKGKNTVAVSGIIYEILEHRLNNQNPTVLISNLSVEGLNQHWVKNVPHNEFSFSNARRLTSLTHIKHSVDFDIDTPQSNSEVG